MKLLEQYSWGKVAELYLESEIRKANSFKKAKKVLALQAHILASAPFIEHLMAVYALDPESADKESDAYRKFYQRSDTTDKPYSGKDHADFYL